MDVPFYKRTTLSVAFTTEETSFKKLTAKTARKKRISDELLIFQ